MRRSSGHSDLELGEPAAIGCLASAEHQLDDPAANAGLHDRVGIGRARQCDGLLEVGPTVRVEHPDDHRAEPIVLPE